MNQHMQDQIADTAKQTLREDKISAALVAKVKGQVTKQDERLDALEKRVKDLTRESRRGGGFPWGLVILAGGAYAAYRFVPAVQERVNKLIDQTKPGVEGNLNRAGEAAKDAVKSGLHGDDPGGATDSATREVKRAGEKIGDRVKDKAEDLTDRLED